MAGRKVIRHVWRIARIIGVSANALFLPRSLLLFRDNGTAQDAVHLRAITKEAGELHSGISK